MNADRPPASYVNIVGMVTPTCYLSCLIYGRAQVERMAIFCWKLKKKRISINY